MTHPAPRQCPVCSGELHVARLACDACHSGLEGKFSLGRFSKLSREQVAFVEAFLACRGKIKDVEQLLGISYPTVVGSAMGFETQESASSPTHAAARKEILEKVATGKLKAAEAAAQIRALRKSGGR